MKAIKVYRDQALTIIKKYTLENKTWGAWAIACHGHGYMALIHNNDRFV